MSKNGATKRCPHCGKTKPRSEFYTRPSGGPYSWCKVCWSEGSAERLRKRNRKLRLEVVAAYGGRCACCGETEEAFLVLDHINGGGKQERDRLGGSQPMYRWLRDRGWPDGYQLLCANCNTARMRGVCPHELSRAQRD